MRGIKYSSWTSFKTAGKQSTVSWVVCGALGLLWKPVIFLMAACAAVVAGLGKFCRRATIKTPTFVHTSCSPPDVVPEKGCGMLGAVTAVPVNLYNRVKDLLAGSSPNNSKGTSQPLLGYSEISALSGTESPTSDDAMLPQLVASSDEELGTDDKKIIMADDGETENKTPVEDVIKCQNASLLSKQSTRPTRNRGMSARKENRKTATTQIANPSFAKPNVNQTHPNDNKKARHGSHARHEQRARPKQRNTVPKGVSAVADEKPKLKVSDDTSSKLGLQQPPELPRDESSQNRDKKNREGQPKRLLTESLKSHSPNFGQETVQPNKPSSQAAVLSIPEMQNTSNTAACSAAEEGNPPLQNVLNKPPLKSEARKENTVDIPGKSGIFDNVSAQESSLRVPVPQATINVQPPHIGASFRGVPSTSPHEHMNEPQPKLKTDAMNIVGLQNKTQLPNKPLPKIVSPKLLAPENTGEKQPLKVTTGTTKSHKQTDRQHKHEPSQKHPAGFYQKTEQFKSLSQSVKQKVRAPRTSKKQPSGTAASSDQESTSITKRRPRNRVQKISDPSSAKYPVHAQEKKSLRKKSSQQAPSNAPAPNETGNKQSSGRVVKSDGATRNIPSDKPKERPQPIHKPRSEKHPGNLQERTGSPTKDPSQKPKLDVPTPNNTSNKQHFKLAPRSNKVSRNSSSREPRNRLQPKSEQSTKKPSANFQGNAGLVNKVEPQVAPGLPQNTSDDEPLQNDTHHSSGREHKAPSVSTMVEDFANGKKRLRPKKRRMTTKRSLQEPIDTESEMIAGNKVTETPIDDKEKSYSRETKKRSATPRDDQAAYVIKPPMRSSEKREGLKAAEQNSVPGPQNTNARHSQDLPSGEWPHIVSARIEGFGPAVIINAQKVETQTPPSHKAPHKKKSLLDAVNKIMEACAKMTHLLEASSTDDDTKLSKTISSWPNSVSRKPKLQDNTNTVFENNGTRNTHSKELPFVVENERKDKHFNSKKTCMLNEQMSIKSESFSWSTKSKTIPLVNLNKPPPRLSNKGTQTEDRSRQTKSVATDCADILPSLIEGSSKPQHTGATTSNEIQKTLQIDLPQNNVTSLVQILEEKAQQRGSHESASPKHFFIDAGKGRDNNATHANTSKRDMRPSAPLPFQNDGETTPTDCPKTPPPIKLPNGSPHVRSVVNFFHHRHANQWDLNEAASASKGVSDREPATHNSGNETHKAAMVGTVKPYQHTGNVESSEMATQANTFNDQGSVLHLNMPRNVSSLVQLLEVNSQKGSKNVSHKPASKLARTGLRRTKKNEVSRSEGMQATACHKDQPWPCQRPRMFRRTVSMPKKTHDTTFR